MSAIALRCISSHWGYAIDATGYHEVRCRGKMCRLANGDAVIHRFDNRDGSYSTLLDDRREQTKPEEDHGRQSTV